MTFGHKRKWLPFEVGQEIGGVRVLAISPGWKTQAGLNYMTRFLGCGHEQKYTHRALQRRVNNNVKAATCRECNNIRRRVDADRKKAWRRKRNRAKQLENEMAGIIAPNWPAPGTG